MNLKDIFIPYILDLFKRKFYIINNEYNQWFFFSNLA